MYKKITFTNIILKKRSWGGRRGEKYEEKNSKFFPSSPVIIFLMELFKFML
jgi:hypothetical protein